MPTVTVVASGGDATAAVNRNLATLLGSNAPTGWVSGLQMRSVDANTEASLGIKVGGSAMTSTNYDYNILPGETAQDSPSEQRVMLRTRYVRTDESANQTLVIRFENS